MKAFVRTVTSLKVNGIALWPFILVRDKKDRDNPTLINHEKIHLRQQMELLILPFYLLYLFNYLINRIRFGEHDKAYREIIFEREAYQNEKNLLYLQSRHLWAWLKHR